MNEIVFIMGKSASGKDRIYRELSEDKALGLNKITMYTTRPLRSGEAEGREYHFVDDDTAKRLENENKIIEIRCMILYSKCGNILRQMMDRLIWLLESGIL